MVYSPDRTIPVAVIAVGFLGAALPLVFLPASSGPVAVAIRLAQAIAVVVGICVVGAGLYSYRTGNLRPAVATGLTIDGLVLVGVLGGLVETSGGPLIPIWAWLVSAVLVIVAAVVTTRRVVRGSHHQNTG